jgi:ribosomal-protein-alanine N-acetyltransferase
VSASAGLTLRPATAADVARIAEIERASFADPWSAGSFRSVLAHAYAALTVADGPGGESVIGYSVIWFVADEAELANLAVAPACRRSGVGGALLDGAIAEARSRGALTVYLEVRDSNEAARGLYRSRGFEEVGRRRQYYRRPVEDAVLMRLSLRYAAR